MADSIASCLVDLFHILWPQGNKIVGCLWLSTDRSECQSLVLGPGPMHCCHAKCTTCATEYKNASIKF